MKGISFVDKAYRTFTEKVPGALTGKEMLLLQLASGEDTVEVMTTGKPIGWMDQKLQGGKDVNVRMLGKGGSVKGIQGGAITVGTFVKGVSGGKVVAAAAGDEVHGLKIGPTTNGVDGDVCEILDIRLIDIQKQALAITITDGEIAALTFSGTPTQAEVEALRDKCEKLADDILAIETALNASGTTS